MTEHHGPTLPEELRYQLPQCVIMDDEFNILGTARTFSEVQMVLSIQPDQHEHKTIYVHCGEGNGERANELIARCFDVYPNYDVVEVLQMQTQDKPRICPVWVKTTYTERTVELYEKAIQLVLDERVNQINKWGIQRHQPVSWLSILTEEFGEMAKEINEDNYDKYVKELIQVCAVGVAMLESALAMETEHE